MSWIPPTTFPPALTEVLGVTLTELVFEASVHIEAHSGMLAEVAEIESHISRAEVNHGLGEFIVEFQLLETLIREAISFLLNKTERTPGLIATAEIPFSRLLNIFLALFHYETRDEEKTKTLGKALDDCGNTNGRRNQLVHSFWYMEDGENIRVKTLVKNLKPYREDEEKMSGKTLEADTKKCKARRERIGELMEESFPKWGLAEMPSEE